MHKNEHPAADKLGIVIIGRNEGERFRKCLASLNLQILSVVYVDSGSTDGSPEFAETQGAVVVNLDMSRPFTAARARNEGLQRLCQTMPGITYVQFIDGDCTVEPDWLSVATAFLDSHPQVAAICGRLSEMFPDASIYNWICNIEWNQADGESEAVGGNAMFRASAFINAGGYDATLIAGEEPELCLRLREQGWRIWRLSAPMGRHDAALTRFSQWWKRAVRGGYGMTKVALMHWHSPRVIWKREVYRVLTYCGLFGTSILAAVFIHPLVLAALLFFPLQITRMAMRRGAADRRSWQYASLLTLSKFAEAKGMASLAWDLLRKRDRKIFDKA
jgi:GT2 family glycosyltransferase